MDENFDMKNTLWRRRKKKTGNTEILDTAIGSSMVYLVVAIVVISAAVCGCLFIPQTFWPNLLEHMPT